MKRRSKGGEITEKTERQNCPSFTRCSASLCPFDPNIKERMWYPDEPVCVRAGMSSEHRWIKTQKKIARKCKNKEKYFTQPMLERLSIVYRGTVGINPERDEESQFKVWFKGHPKREKKKISEEGLKKLREGLRKWKRGKQIELF